MKSAGILGIERFARGLLGGESKVTASRSMLSKRGYDLELLRELLGEYRRLPKSELRFLIEGDVDTELRIARKAGRNQQTRR